MRLRLIGIYRSGISAMSPLIIDLMPNGLVWGVTSWTVIMHWWTTGSQSGVGRRRKRATKTMPTAWLRAVIRPMPLDHASFVLLMKFNAGRSSINLGIVLILREQSFPIKWMEMAETTLSKLVKAMTHWMEAMETIFFLVKRGQIFMF